MKDTEKVERALRWFKTLDDVAKTDAARGLFEHAIQSEWINVWCDEDAYELAEEERKPVSYYRAPYYTTCGEPLWERVVETDF